MRKRREDDECGKGRARDRSEREPQHLSLFAFTAGIRRSGHGQEYRDKGADAVDENFSHRRERTVVPRKFGRQVVFGEEYINVGKKREEKGREQNAAEKSGDKLHIY